MVIFSPCEKPCQVRLLEEHMLSVCLNQCLRSLSLCPLSFGNDYTLSAEQIYYRWSSLVPCRDPGKLPPYALFPYATAPLEFCLCTLSNFSLCENKRSKSDYGLGERPEWTKTADGTRSRRRAMWRLTPRIVSGAAVWIPLPISPIFPEIPISAAIHTGSSIRLTSCAFVLENLTAN